MSDRFFLCHIDALVMKAKLEKKKKEGFLGFHQQNMTSRSCLPSSSAGSESFVKLCIRNVEESQLCVSALSQTQPSNVIAS